jgi:hypothetical protein
MPQCDKSSWWLDLSALPDRYLWAHLTVLPNGRAEVVDCDGTPYTFQDEQAARNWLLEDEYSTLASLIEQAEVPAELKPPSSRFGMTS